MKLLFLNHNVAWSGGTFFRAYHFARCLVKQGHEVTLLSISPRNRMSFSERLVDGVRVIETPDCFWGSARSGWDPWDALRRVLFVRGQRWDLVHAFDSRPAVVVPALALRNAGVPVVMDWADWWGRGGTLEVRQAGNRWRRLIRPIETFFEEAYRTTVDATTVVSRALRNRAMTLGVRPDTIAQIPGGCDIEGLLPRSKTECREALGIPQSTPLIGYLGILSLPDALLFFETCRSIGQIRPDCRFVMIGNHRSRVPRIDGLIETGFVAHTLMATWLGACDILMLPLKNTIASRARWPSKFNDYLAAGRPVISTAVSDVVDFFTTHDIGRCAVDEPLALATAAVEMLGDPAALQRNGDNARLLAESELAWPVLTNRLEAHYARLLRAS